MIMSLAVSGCLFSQLFSNIIGIHAYTETLQSWHFLTFSCTHMCVTIRAHQLIWGSWWAFRKVGQTWRNTSALIACLNSVLVPSDDQQTRKSTRALNSRVSLATGRQPGTFFGTFRWKILCKDLDLKRGVQGPARGGLPLRSRFL